ncbi:MAG: DUF6484 domain-containing protein [Cellvibrionaceae bacterium]|nr:DUF6484 domain-containing protein [Cellvibrionaceae bacterium]
MTDSSPTSKSGLFIDAQPVLAPGEIILGQLLDLDHQGNPLVDYDCNPDDIAQVAVSTLPIIRQHLGRQVALLFASGNLRKPVIMGFIHNPLDALLENFSDANSENITSGSNSVEEGTFRDIVTVDGRKVVIEGEEEVVLRCGESSITLTKAGKIVIRGKYLLSRASGVNRILGGSVQVN